MLNALIRFSLTHRLLILATAVAVMALGSMVAESLPIDVLPALTRPRVVLVTECEGLAPEEVEQRVTVPLESAVNGATGVTAVRSSSDIGLSVINIEFEWGVDVFRSRQIVQERIATVQDRLPENIQPQLGRCPRYWAKSCWSACGARTGRPIRSTCVHPMKMRITPCAKFLAATWV